MLARANMGPIPEVVPAITEIVPIGAIDVTWAFRSGAELRVASTLSPNGVNGRRCRPAPPKCA
ncbi:MAG TPA: hypothetical protein VFM85_00145 [Actinomycetota bacterium]|nr:hypothetical protein [Actinomycetota bacterium]